MRKAFTLIELLIVVGIIAVLAGLLFPAVGMVRRQVDNVKCSSNMRQIAIALETYRQEFNDKFPYNLRAGQNPLLPSANIETYGNLPPKLFLCPLDKRRGADANMGRAAYPSWGDYTNLYESGSSYCFEASSDTKKLLNDGAKFRDDIAYFWRDVVAAARPTLWEKSWADAKINQQLHGNLKDPNNVSLGFGEGFPSSYVPIVRCYHHFDWPSLIAKDGINAANTVKKVNNISLDFNVFWSTPTWEKDVSPNIP